MYMYIYTHTLHICMSAAAPPILSVGLQRPRASWRHNQTHQTTGGEDPAAAATAGETETGDQAGSGGVAEEEGE